MLESPLWPPLAAPLLGCATGTCLNALQVHRNLESCQNAPKRASRVCTNLFPMSTLPRSGSTVLYAPQGPWVAKGWLFGEWKELRYGEGFIWVSSRPSRYRAKLWSWYHGPKASSPRRMARVWWRTLGRLRAPKNLGFLVFMKVYFVRVGGSNMFYLTMCQLDLWLLNN